MTKKEFLKLLDDVGENEDVVLISQKQPTDRYKIITGDITIERTVGVNGDKIAVIKEREYYYEI